MAGFKLAPEMAFVAQTIVATVSPAPNAPFMLAGAGSDLFIVMPMPQTTSTSRNTPMNSANAAW